MSDEVKTVTVTLISPDFREGVQYNVGDEVEVGEWEVPNMIQARLIAPHPVDFNDEAQEAHEENLEAVQEEQHRQRADHQDEDES
jgi:hypothetical protein